MLPNKTTKLLQDVERFNALMKDATFSLDEFEARAESLNQTKPGKGYQLAYQETLSNFFKATIKKVSETNQVRIPMDQIVWNFDMLVTRPYLEECEKQGVNINLTPNDGIGMNVETLETLKKVLDETPNTVARRAAEEFKTGEMTTERALKWVNEMKPNKDKIKKPEREDAIKMVSYANVIAKQNKDRPFFKMLFNLGTHFEEKRAIKTLRSFASRLDDVAKLEKEADKEPEAIANIRQTLESDMNIAKKNEAGREHIDLKEFKNSPEKTTKPVSQSENVLSKAIDDLLS